MRPAYKYVVVVLAVLHFGIAHAEGLRELSESNYKNHGENKSIIILQINWGRIWNCGGYENAQLQKLVFKRLPLIDKTTNPVSLEFVIPSRLLAKNAFLPYSYIVEPGEYALSESDVKVARSVRDVGHLQGNEAQFFKDGKPIGGTFKAVANEAVYIGTFGLDCYKEPIPWRFYIEGRDEFDRFVEGFRQEYPFVKNMPVAYRLFATSIFGQPYSLKDK